VSTGTGLELSEVVSCHENGFPAWTTAAGGIFDLQVKPNGPAPVVEAVAATCQAIRRIEYWRSETARLADIPSADQRAAAWLDLAATVRREAVPVAVRLEAAHAVLEAEAARPEAPSLLGALARGIGWNAERLCAEVERLTDPARHAGFIDRRAVERVLAVRKGGRP